MTEVAAIPPDRLQSALGDRYRLESEVGAGGMATVYAAEDTRHGRRVAVKVLRPELASTLGAERFLREIAIAARLQHPHILGLLDSGGSNGLLYYVMPFVDGASLRVKLRREGELPLDAGVRLLQQVLDALAYAHGEGIVHRDIKPENVMLSGKTSHAGSRWHALVADFGVAKAVSEAAANTSLTATGIAMGTPAYMAPEQAAADPHVDHRADIYAVGILAYEIFAGAPPFGGVSPQHVIAAHMTRTPESISRQRPAIPAELDHLIMRALEKRPADRWQSAQEMLARLEALSTPTHGVTAAAPRAEPVDRKFRINEAVVRKLERATLDPRVIGSDLHYLDNGVRADVLVTFLSGTGQDQELFRELASTLPYHIIAPTIFGFEPVARRRIPLSLSNHLRIMRELLGATIEDTRPATVVIAGFSAGSDLAMRLVADVEDLPQIDGVLSLGCNLSIETCWATRVFARVRPGEESSMLEDLRTLSSDASTLDEWINSHAYFVDVLRKFGQDLEAIRRFSQEIVAPFDAPGEETFARWFRKVSERVPSLRCVSEDSRTSARLVQALRMRNLDSDLLGERYREDSIVVEPGTNHFDLMRPDIVRRHLDDVIAGARAAAR